MTTASISEDEVVIVIGWKHLAAALAIILVALAAWPYISERFGPGLSLSTDKTEYKPGDQVKIEGWARESWFTPLSSEPVAIEVRSGDNLIWIDQVSTDSHGYFTSSFTLREGIPTGEYKVYVGTLILQGYTTFSVYA